MLQSNKVTEKLGKLFLVKAYVKEAGLLNTFPLYKTIL